MFSSIIASGLAMGAVYALIGITYNTMFATSRVMSFTAGQLGMLGGVFGSLLMLRLGLPLVLGLPLTLLICAMVGVVREVAAGGGAPAGAGPATDPADLRDGRRRHGVRGGAAGAQKPRPALVRADDPGR